MKLKTLLIIILVALMPACWKTRRHYVTPHGMPENIFENTDSFATAVSITYPKLEKRFLVKEENLFFGLFYSPQGQVYLLAVAFVPSNGSGSGNSMQWSAKSLKSGTDVFRQYGRAEVKYKIHDDETSKFLFGSSFINQERTSQYSPGQWVAFDVPETDFRIEGKDDTTKEGSNERYSFSASIDPSTGHWKSIVTRKK